jgi:hypothetical protein
VTTSNPTNVAQAKIKIAVNGICHHYSTDSQMFNDT